MQPSLFSDKPDINFLPYDGSAVLHAAAIAPQRAAAMLDSLAGKLAWQVHKIFVYGRWVEQPRLTAWYGDPGRDYLYSGIALTPTPWTPALLEIRDRCEALAGERFNSVLANLYRDGNDGVAWHSDNEKELGTDPIIASVSLGQERRFDLRHRRTGETVRVPLPCGSILIMSGATQRHWLHQVAKTRKPIGPRINLTFRRIHE